MHWGLHFPKQYGSRVMQQILKCNSLWKCHTYKPGARRHQFYRSDQMSVQVAMSGPESDPLFLANVGVAEGCFWHQWSVIFSLVQVAISLTLRHEVSMERVTIVSMAIFSTFSGCKQKPPRLLQCSECMFELHSADDAVISHHESYSWWTSTHSSVLRCAGLLGPKPRIN